MYAFQSFPAVLHRGFPRKLGTDAIVGDEGFRISSAINTHGDTQSKFNSTVEIATFRCGARRSVIREKFTGSGRNRARRREFSFERIQQESEINIGGFTYRRYTVAKSCLSKLIRLET